MAELPVPGTVHQVDLTGNLTHVRHNDKQKDIILVPQPSDHPDDPLNWSKWRKLTTSFAVMSYTFIAGSMINALWPAYLMISAETGMQLEDMNTGVGVMYLFLGFGNLIWQPIAMNYGRRPVLVFSLLATVLFILWSAYVTTTWEWYLNRVLIGIVLAPIESLIEVCVADVHFAHDRGLYLGCYAMALFSAGFIPAIPGGFIADRFGWRWVQYACAIVGAVTFIIVFFSLEETMFYREHTIEPEYADRIPEETEESGTADTKGQVLVLNNNIPTESKSEAPSAKSDDGPAAYKPKPYLQRLKLWGARDVRQPKHLFKDMLLSVTVIRFPAVIYSGLLVGSILAWFNVVNGSMATVLGGAPYNFTARELGIVYVAPLIGVIVGSYLSGWMNDKIALFMARRNGGVSEPEHRLWISLIPLIIHPAGCLLYGVGSSYGIHWVGVAFGLTLIGATLPMGTTVSCNYVIDCYKEISGPTLVTIILIRNTMGFVFGYAVLPMIQGMGIRNAFILLAFLGMLFWLTSFLMIYIGKKCRISSASVYWRLVEEQGLKAH